MMCTVGAMHAKPLCFRAYVTLAAATLFLLSAGAQTDPSRLTDDALLEQRHRATYRKELDYRLIERSLDERAVLQKKLLEPPSRPFPTEYTEDELFDHLRTFRDIDPGYKALTELQRRYNGAEQSEVTELFNRIRGEYRAIPYPVFEPENPKDPGYRTNSEAYHGLDEATKGLLPEDLALKLFQEVYLESGQKGAITAFLVRLNDVKFSGPATGAALEGLVPGVAGYDEQKLKSLGEHEALEGILMRRIDQWNRQQLDNSFAAVKGRNWREDPMDITAMGRFEEPEALELLLAYYDSLPKDQTNDKGRLYLLGVLLSRPERAKNGEVQRRLRDDLTKTISQDYSQRLLQLVSVVETIEKTNDPYYIPLLERRLADLDWREIRRTTTLPEELVEVNIRTTREVFERAIVTLEEVRSAGE